MRRIVSLACLIGLALVLSDCAYFSKMPPPISSNPGQNIANILPAGTGTTVITGLQNAAYNLDQAIAIMVLPPNDPADACVHGALKAIGQDIGMTPAPPAPSFTPKVTDLLSAGSVAYILAQQAKQFVGSGGLAIPPSCEQLVGHFVLTGINAPANVVIGGIGGLVP